MMSFLAVIKVESKNIYDNLIFCDTSMKAAIKRVARTCYYEYDHENNTKISLLKVAKTYEQYLKNYSDLTIKIVNSKNNKTWQNKKNIEEDLIDNWVKSFDEVNDEYARQLEEDEYYEQLGILPPRIEQQFIHLINSEKEKQTLS